MRLVMNIGVPKEIKTEEYRVGLTPSSVKELVLAGHQVLVEYNAGQASGFYDQDYLSAGATLANKTDIFEQATLIIKVKEPLLEEVDFFTHQHILFTFLHLAADLPLTLALLAKKCLCIAYETVTRNNNELPLLQPMSAVAGRLSIQAGAKALEKTTGGCGILLGGVAGVKPAQVTIIGGGIVGLNAAQMAVGLGAKVSVLDKNTQQLNKLNELFTGRIETIYSTTDNISEYVEKADLVIGSVLIPGAKAPKLVTEAHIKNMRSGSAVVDVAIDQGGCFETSKATTHLAPTFLCHDVVHYCVTNMPGAVPKTATEALNNATLSYILLIANNGINKAIELQPGLLNGINLSQGQVCLKEVATSLSLPYSPFSY